MVALNERLPDACKLLPSGGQPGPHEGRRRSLRDVVADRRAARAAHRTGPPPPGLAEWHADRQRRADQLAERRHAGAAAERRVAEALRARAADHNANHQERSKPPAEPADWERDRQGEGRDREREDDFGDSWRTYRERADHIRQTYGWTVPEPPPGAENWLPLGRDDDQERDSDREDR
jgi:hypothetical protein